MGARGVPQHDATSVGAHGGHDIEFAVSPPVHPQLLAVVTHDSRLTRPKRTDHHQRIPVGATARVP